MKSALSLETFVFFREIGTPVRSVVRFHSLCVLCVWSGQVWVLSFGTFASLFEIGTLARDVRAFLGNLHF